MSENSKNDQHIEVWLLFGLAMACIFVLAMLAVVKTEKDILLAYVALFGPVLTGIVNSMRGVRSSAAMQTMAEQLGNSSPTPRNSGSGLANAADAPTGNPGDPVHVTDDTGEGKK